jgi:uncharacterized protein YecE (DUF72 family)
MISQLRCGVSGWSHPDWNGTIYSKRKAKGFHPLAMMAESFDTVEIDQTFHAPVREEASRLWLHKVSGNPRFVFSAGLWKRFTHERSLDEAEIKTFKNGLWPLLNARKLGCLVMQFPWSFRYTAENREFFIRLRRSFHEFPLVAEMRHASWMMEEAVGTMIDYRVGFVNIDQPEHVKAMPPTSFLTSAIGYVRLHGRDHHNWLNDFGKDASAVQQAEYFYSREELSEWKLRVDRINQHAAASFVVFTNDIGGNSVYNALTMETMVEGAERPASKVITRQPELFRAVA